MKKNDIFIAHTKCVHAGGEASKEKSTVVATLEDYDGETKNIVDVSLYFHFTFDVKNFDAVARKALIK